MELTSGLFMIVCPGLADVRFKISFFLQRNKFQLQFSVTGRCKKKKNGNDYLGKFHGEIFMLVFKITK